MRYVCDSHGVEDEYHFIMNCSAFDNLRYTLMQSRKRTPSNFNANSKSKNQLCIFLFL